MRVWDSGVPAQLIEPLPFRRVMRSLAIASHRWIPNCLELLRCHHLAHRAPVTFYSAMLCFVVCMFVVACAALLHAALLATVTPCSSW